jgi:hypothetical protein
MTGPRPMGQGLDKADVQLRSTLSSWRQRRRYRAEASTRYRRDRVKDSSQTDLDRELKREHYTEWQWFLIPLLALTIIDFLWLQRWG